MQKLSKVVVVGRTNVGKSTLFNRLAENVKSLTLDYEGVTRDFLTDTVNWNGVNFELVDSGGISLQKKQDFLDEHVRRIALDLVQQADLIMFVVDAQAGLLAEDRQLATYLHKTEKPVVLVVNKIDVRGAQETMYEFEQLGFKSTVYISAQHGTSIVDLLELLIARLPKKVTQAAEEEPKLVVTLLGKPNVGKSSLMNSLLNKDRMLVTDIPGTTREAVTEAIKFYQETILLTDTPGIRRKRSVEEPLEKMMVKSAFRAIDRSNVILLLIDGSSRTLADQELKLAFYTLEQGKALILLINKVDLVDQDDRALLEDQFSIYNHLFKKIPHLYISCKTRKNVGSILPLITEVWQRYTQKISDQEITTLFKNALEKTPLHHKTEPLILYQASQVSTGPITILLKVNQPQWFGESQLAFFENKLRSTYNLIGVPVVFVVRKKAQLKR